MIPNRFSALLGTFWLCSLLAAGAEVIINEILVRNPGQPNDPNALLDMDGKSPGWLELYNSGSQTEDLSGWALSDDPNIPGKWIFAAPIAPAAIPTTVPAGGYLIVFCGGLEHNVAAIEPHTTFGLDNGGMVLLSRPDGSGGWTAVSSMGTPSAPYPAQREGISYGLPDNNPGAPPVFFVSDTPRAANAAEGVAAFCDNLTFSVERGLYDAPFTLTITCPTPGTTIVWTVNGSLPSATNGTQSAPSGPGISGSATLPVNGTTIIRACAIREWLGNSLVATRTYIFPAQVLTQNGPLPSMNLGADDTFDWGKSGDSLRTPTGPDWEVDPEIVNNTNAQNKFTEEDLKKLPVMSLVTSWREAFGPRVPSQAPVNERGFYVGNEVGVAEESADRRASLELINPEADAANPNGTAGFQVNGNVHVFGGTSQDRWKSYKLSMRFKAEDTVTTGFYGAGASREQELFILDARLSQVWVHPDATQRARGDYVRDHVMADLQINMGRASTRARPVHFFLNGLYWGMYIIHERPNDVFAAAYQGGDSSEWDVFKHSGSNGTDGAALYENIVDSNVLDPAKKLGVTSDAAYFNSTTLKNWEDLLDLVGIGRVSPNPVPDLQLRANYEAVAARLDIPAFCDYMLLNVVAANSDWPHKNLYASFRRTDPAGMWRFHSWDAEHVFRTTGESTFTQANWTVDTRGPGAILRKLAVNAEFRLAFADNIQRRIFNSGALSTEALKAAFSKRFAEIDPSGIRGESARWGDNRATTPYRYTPDWTNEKNRILNTILPERGATGATPANSALNQCKQFRVGATAYPLYPAVAAPEFRDAGTDTARHGGIVPAGFHLKIQHPTITGTIYYTTDGSDPRTPWSGDPAPSALTWTTPVTLTAAVTVRSRVLEGSNWSAVTAARFSVDAEPASAANLVISEFNYHPANPSPAEIQAGFSNDTDFEYIELKNIGSKSVLLDACAFVSGLSFTFTENSAVREILPGGYALLVENQAAFAFRHGGGRPVAGVFALDSSLSNSGERLTLLDATGGIIRDFTYDDSAPWPVSPDGSGNSLVLSDPGSNPDHSLPASWKASASANGGTPGTGESAAPATYATWKQTYGIISDTADGDGDGFEAILEYCFGTDPGNATSRPAIEIRPQTLTISGLPDTYLTVRFLRSAATGISMVPEFATELFTWIPSEMPQRLSQENQPDGRILEVWRAPAPIPAAGNPRHFARIRATIPAGQ